MVELGLIPSLDVAYAEYARYIMNGMMTQLARIEPGKNVEEAHMRNRKLIAEWCYEQGKAANVIEWIEQDGKTYVVVNDYTKLRELLGRMLREVQRIKSEGDFEAGKTLVEKYAVTVDPKLHAEVLTRYKALDIEPYSGFVNPQYELVEKNGKVVDVNNILDGEGCFSPERSGTVPVGDLVKMCFSGKYTQKEIYKKICGNGGFTGYLHTNDAREVGKMAESGDALAKQVWEAFFYQIAKDAGAMAAVLHGKVDQIILTGGIAYNPFTAQTLTDYLGWIAPVTTYPGEDELLALCQGALRVMTGEEEAKKALDAAKNIFGGGNTENMPVAEITADIFNDGQTDLMSIIVQAGLAASKSEARRAIEQGGVSVNGEKITDVKRMFTPDDFAEEFVLKKGKKNFRKVVYKA